MGSNFNLKIALFSLSTLLASYYVNAQTKIVSISTGVNNIISDTIKPSEILITGFSPYGPYNFNNSEFLAKQISEKKGYSVEILPVKYEGMKETMDSLIALYKPKMVVSLGFNLNAYNLELLTSSKNYFIDYFGDSSVVEVERDMDSSNVLNIPSDKLTKIISDLDSQGINYSINNPDEKYVCNALAYYMMQKADKEGFDFYFIHVPSELHDSKDDLVKMIDVLIKKD